MKQRNKLYLDYAAATPLDAEVLAVMKPYFNDIFFNPSADYLAAKDTRSALDTARAAVAYCLGAKPGEVIFTAGGSEANNLAIKGIMDGYPKAKLLISAIEHESVIAPAKGYIHKTIKVTRDGRLDLADLQNKLDDSVVLVSIMYANNEVGTIEPLKEAAAVIAEARIKRHEKGNPLPLLLHSDACQAANYLDLHVSRLGVDLMSLNGSKLYGPKQSGALFVRAGVRLQPLIDGGGQEMGIRSGTENVAGSIGFSAALAKAQQMRHDETARLKTLREYFISELNREFPDCVINGSPKYRLPNNVHVTFPGQDNERLLIKLDQNGVMAAAGSACSASKRESSHVLKAMGLSDNYARSSLRITLGRQTTQKDINTALAVFKQIIS